MKSLLLALTLGFAACSVAAGSSGAATGVASWYGEDHRGRLMANGKEFNPDHLTAASWFYPLGSKVRVTAKGPGNQSKAVIVRITDRGPAMDLVREGRIIDLTHAAFQRLSSPDRGLVAVKVEKVPKPPRRSLSSSRP
jgi:peptidoglycan lytic transglycosylase